MLNDLAEKIALLPIEVAVKALIEGIAFEFAVAGNDTERLGAVQADVGKNATKLATAALAVPAAAEPKATPIEQTPLASPKASAK